MGAGSFMRVNIDGGGQGVAKGGVLHFLLQGCALLLPLPILLSFRHGRVG